MINRHLLPDEIDLLVDGDVGFGVAPLRAHVRQCAECRTRVDEARETVDALESLPHLAPSPLFAERVMAQVHVFEPWHVAARDSIRRFVPRSLPARAAAAVAAASMSVALTVFTVWIATRLDLLSYVGGAAIEQGRVALATVLAAIVGTAFGPEAAAFVRTTGAIGLLITSFALAGVATAAVIGVRRLATASSRRAGEL